MTTPGYREIQHTADWELEVWAPDLPALFEQAAGGMYALSGTQLADLSPSRPDSRQTRQIELQAYDAEGLLVKFLGELLYLGEHERLGFDTFDLRIRENELQAQVSGAPIVAVAKEIKAVTYHNLSIYQTGRGLEVHIVFDV